jgi:hypothetical protein
MLVSSRTQQFQQILQQRQRIIVLDQSEQEARVHEVIATYELRWDVFLQVEVSETDIVWQQVLGRSLMQSNVETFQSVGVRIFFSLL